MTDDIVTRLRDWAKWGDGKRETSPIENPFTDSWAKVSLEAADEIEYLRNELAELNGEYQKLWNKHNAVMRDRKHPLTNDYIGDI